MAEIIYEPSPHFEAEIAQDSEVESVRLEAADLAAQHARGLVPGHHGFQRGRARISRSYVAEMTDDGPALVSTSSFWHLAEYGSVNNPPYAPLRRGVEAAGCEFTDSRRGLL